jgi:hypothetical protein
LKKAHTWQRQFTVDRAKFTILEVFAMAHSLR